MHGLAQGGRRLCGDGRILGGWYLECAVLASGTHPLDHFLVDFPTLVPTHLSVNALGVTLWTDPKGVTHVVDLIGESHYPFVPDFWEEARRMGFSRKISPTLPVGKLSAQSRFLFIHPKALVANPEALVPHLEGTHVCPTGKRHPANTSCTGLHWWVTPSATPGTLTRYLGEGEYELRGRLGAGAPAVRYARAIFASVPITGISHIVGQGGVQGANRAQFAAAQRSGLPVFAFPV
ncbi:hypothetical protein Dcar01_01236 [Deinococcus carri]|uniref:Uncharacterized protein n=1 Tax=Deinococcus carri TaxID=1211323 RepID=A0ABP9W580_9DEIO